MAKSHSKPAITKKLAPAAKPAWIEEEDKAEAAKATATQPATPATPKAPKEPKAPGEGRKPNHNSFRWVAIDIIAKNPGKSQEELIALMDKAKPGKDGAYWKRRIARAHALTKKFAMLKKGEAWQVELPPRPVTPKAAKPAKDDGVEEV